MPHEVVRCDALSRVHIGLDYFDASINRIGAYVIGSRATQKCFLQALLEPLALLRKYEAEGRFFERLALLEECMIAKIAEIKGVSVEEVEQTTRENAFALFTKVPR